VPSSARVKVAHQPRAAPPPRQGHHAARWHWRIHGADRHA
jgi:hypothetical protein